MDSLLVPPPPAKRRGGRGKRVELAIYIQDSRTSFLATGGCLKSFGQVEVLELLEIFISTRWALSTCESNINIAVLRELRSSDVSDPQKVFDLQFRAVVF